MADVALWLGPYMSISGKTSICTICTICTEQALPPSFPLELDPPVLPREEVSPQPIADGADGMDVDAGEVGGRGTCPNCGDKVPV